MVFSKKRNSTEVYPYDWLDTEEDNLEVANEHLKYF